MRPHLHKKGIDDPQILFMAFWKIINRSSIGIRSDHPNPGLENVMAAFFVSLCVVLLTCLFVQESASVSLTNFLFFEWFSCICNVPLALFLLVQACPLFLLEPKFLFFALFRVLLFFLFPENRILQCSCTCTWY